MALTFKFIDSRAASLIQTGRSAFDKILSIIR